MALSDLSFKTELWKGRDVEKVLYNQDFGFELEEYSAFRESSADSPEKQLQECENPIFPIDAGFSEIFDTDTEFEVHLKVKPFRMEDIKVTIGGNVAKVQFEHPFVEEGQGEAKRKFRRIYALPPTCDSYTLKAFVTSDGILVLNCKKHKFEERNINLGLSLCDGNAPV